MQRFAQENAENEGDTKTTDTVPTQQTPEPSDDNMTKWPKKVRHRGKVLAKVYRPCQGRGSYRVVWRAAGQRQMKSLPSYAGPGGAKEYAEALVKQLAAQSQAIMLTSPQATDALAALERLNTFRETTGRKLSLLAVVSEYCEAAAKLRGHTLADAAQGFLRTVATVKRVTVAEAVEEFLAAEEPRTRAAEGQRAQLSAKYHYNKSKHLRRFAGTFSGSAVHELGKHDLDAFMSSPLLAGFSPKSRNHHRTAIAQFLSWSARKDYLHVGHRLHEADGMRPEHANTAEVQTYTARELRKLLETASGPLRAMIALGGLGGLRTEELLRLDWADVWRVQGHVEITAGKSKTRQRRLVEMSPALAAWLQPYREFTTGPLWTNAGSMFGKFSRDLWKAAGVARKDNALRHSFCSYAYVLKGENWTAQQAGNSPGMIHGHYKGLATRQEAQAWFAVKPAKGSAADKILHVPGLAGSAA